MCLTKKKTTCSIIHLFPHTVNKINRSYRTPYPLLPSPPPLPYIFSESVTTTTTTTKKKFVKFICKLCTPPQHDPLKIYTKASPIDYPPHIYSPVSHGDNTHSTVFYHVWRRETKPLSYTNLLR